MALKGVKFTEIHKKRISDALKGYIKTDEHREKLRQALKGIKPKCSNVMFGKDNPAWKGGVTNKNKLARSTAMNKNWRIKVFERDNYTCIWCGKHGIALQADHIKPFALYPELRFVLDNGRTLCIDCHRKTDTYMGIGSKRTFYGGHFTKGYLAAGR